MMDEVKIMGRMEGDALVVELYESRGVYVPPVAVVRPPGFIDKLLGRTFEDKADKAYKRAELEAARVNAGKRNATAYLELRDGGE